MVKKDISLINELTQSYINLSEIVAHAFKKCHETQNHEAFQKLISMVETEMLWCAKALDTKLEKPHYIPAITAKLLELVMEQPCPCSDHNNTTKN